MAAWSSNRPAILGSAAGIAVGVLVATLLVSSGYLHRAPTTEGASDAFVQAYQRSRFATFTLQGTFSRTAADGRGIASAALVVQRPPDELHRQLGSVSGRLKGRSLNCPSTLSGQVDCLAGGEVPPWEEMVQEEMTNLQAYFVGNPPLYRVSRDENGCFVLEQVRAVIEAPFGAYARMCFDPATGARSYLEVHREGGVIDVLEASQVLPVADDRAFDITADEDYEAEPVG